MSLPWEWVKAGFDRSNAAFAANGNNDLGSVWLVKP